jgi:hypothetical protein
MGKVIVREDKGRMGGAAPLLDRGEGLPMFRRSLRVKGGKTRYSELSRS